MIKITNLTIRILSKINKFNVPTRFLRMYKLVITYIHLFSTKFTKPTCLKSFRYWYCGFSSIEKKKKQDIGDFVYLVIIEKKSLSSVILVRKRKKKKKSETESRDSWKVAQFLSHVIEKYPKKLSNFFFFKRSCLDDA